MSLQEDIEALSMHESFARLIEQVNSDRENAISEMREASNSQLQQISGVIVECDNILKLCNWPKLRERHKSRLRDVLK